MNILVTAGNTVVPIDRVRVITNVFTGRTGAEIAVHCQTRGHIVTLLTSHPEAVQEPAAPAKMLPTGLTIQRFRTFDALHDLLKEAVLAGRIDVIIHSAAVSDHRVAGVYAPQSGTQFDPERATWTSPAGAAARFLNREAGKVKSDEPELWLRLVRNIKLVDRFRSEWGFRGILVKFKLEVGLTEQELLPIAERSRLHSQADLMVANTLEGAQSWAVLGPLGGRYERVARQELPERLLAAVENLAGGQGHA